MYIQSLIIKSLENTISTKEKIELDHWLEADKNNEYYKQIKEIWEASGESNYELLEDINAEQGLLKLKQRIKQQNPQIGTKKNQSRRYLLAACFAFVALSIGYLVLNNSILTNEYNIIVAEQNMELSLPDDSKIWLNKGSEIKYQKDFENRNILLDGTAMFDVTHNPESPFTIETADVKVTVLGTKFIVGNDREKSKYVQVINGKVNVSNLLSKNDTHILTKDMSIVRNNENIFEATENTNNSMFWASNLLSYKDAPLTDIFSELEIHFEVDIQENSSLENCKFTGKFQGEDLSHILNNLMFIYNLTIDDSDKSKILISGNPC